MKIVLLRDTETIRYAAEELLKYLKMMSPEIEGDITVGEYDGEAVRLGLLCDLGLSDEGVKDAMLDDLVDADISSLCGYIGGSNERSVLFGVYNYLKSAGCRWVRPGPLGEYIPEVDMASHAYRERHLADYPFRGECGEGACSFEHLYDTVVWLPKQNMNLFMIQQIVPYNFLHRWYRHIDNTRMPHDDIPYEDYVQGCKKLEMLVKKCGLQLHILGHGALTEPFGIRHMVQGYDYNISEEAKQAFALVKGKRGLYEGSPFFTQACMSQGWVRERVVSWIAEYLKENPHIDFLHFWLGDSRNNHCECPDCLKGTPSDFFVQMLNELDERLSRDGNDAKIVFILYNDTLWPPKAMRLNNPARFIMLAACGTGRVYSSERYSGGIPERVHNDVSLPATGMAMTLTFIDGWRDIYPGKTILFEYFLYTYHYGDVGTMNFNRWMISNMKNLHTTGLDGIMSCQTQRSYFPTGIASTVVGEFLFNSSLDERAYVEDYFKATFGEGWGDVLNYLEEITHTFDIKALTQNTDITAQDTGAKDKNSTKATIFGNTRVGDIIATAPTIVDNFAKIIDKNLDTVTNPCHRESWELLRYYGEYCKWVSRIYFALSRNDTEGARRQLDGAMDYLSEVEPRIAPYFDNFLFRRRTAQIIKGQ